MLLLRNADVFAPTPLGHQSLLIGGGKVLWMGSGSELPELPAALRNQATIIDLGGRAADAHVAGLQTNKAGILHPHHGDGPRVLSLIRDALAHNELPPRVFNPTHVNRRRAMFDEAVDVAKRGCIATRRLSASR